MHLGAGDSLTQFVAEHVSQSSRAALAIGRGDQECINLSGIAAHRSVDTTHFRICRQALLELFGDGIGRLDRAGGGHRKRHVHFALIAAWEDVDADASRAKHCHAAGQTRHTECDDRPAHADAFPEPATVQHAAQQVSICLFEALKPTVPPSPEANQRPIAGFDGITKRQIATGEQRSKREGHRQ